MSNKRYALSRGISAAKALAGARLAVAALNLLVQFLLIRFLASDDYVAFLLCTSFATVQAVVTMIGVDRVVYRHVPAFVSDHDLRSVARLFRIFLLMRFFQTTTLVFFMAAIPLEWWPSLFNAVISSYFFPLVFFCFALTLTDSLAIYAGSLGLQKKQSAGSFVVVSIRAGVILIAITTGAVFSLDLLLWWFVVTEILYGLVLASILIFDFYASRALFAEMVPRTNLNSSWGFLKEGLGTQVSYLLRLPFLGSSIRLVVAVFAGPAATAAFGFFQTLADRVYQFLPLILFKGIIEPALSADYERTANPQRIATSLSLLLRLNLVILVPMSAFLVAGEETLAALLAGSRYVDYWHFAPLALLLVVSQLTSEMLWVGLNPMGDVAAINRIWRWCCVFGFFLLCGAVFLRSVEAVVCACMVPNISAFVWLRYVKKHPLLKCHWVFNGFLSIVKSAIFSAAPLALANLVEATSNEFIFLMTISSVCYLLLLKFFGVFSADEVRSINEVAPKAALFFRFFSRGSSA